MERISRDVKRSPWLELVAGARSFGAKAATRRFLHFQRRSDLPRMIGRGRRWIARPSGAGQMVALLRAGKASKSRGSEPASEAAELAAPAANLPEWRRSERKPVEPCGRRRMADSRGQGRWSLLPRMKGESAALRSPAMRQADHGVSAVFGGVAGELPAGMGSGRRCGSCMGKVLFLAIVPEYMGATLKPSFGSQQNIPPMKKAILLSVIFSALVSTASVWMLLRFYPHLLIKQTVVRSAVESESQEKGSAPPAADAPMDPDHLLAMLEDAAEIPDESKEGGFTDQELADSKSDDAVAVCDEAFKHLTEGNGKPLHWCGLGRYYFAFGDYARARQCFENAAPANLGTAYYYLASERYTPDDKTSWNLLEKAKSTGCKHAAKRLVELGNKIAEEIDRAFADEDDRDLPDGSSSVSQARILMMKPFDVELLIKSHKFLVTKPGFSQRFAYELGRAAFIHHMQSDARELLTYAAENGSGAAHALLAYEPYTFDEKKQIEHLQKAVELKYEPAKVRLELILETRKAISGAR